MCVWEVKAMMHHLLWCQNKSLLDEIRRGLCVGKLLRSPVRQTHSEASRVTSTHIITSLLDEIQKPSMCDARRVCTPLQGYRTTMLGHKPYTLLALDTYMALADVLLQL